MAQARGPSSLGMAEEAGGGEGGDGRGPAMAIACLHVSRSAHQSVDEPATWGA